ncbi:TM2 domain-containing protein almondex isoform X2 [Anopheles arabiensis]|uniref:TM2 domain-containing protein n=2 Tax=gambiae species complex TaxID=44542 RepID=A0A6E8VNW0_ANOCL|nr:TM2 domain-containing protein almondex isoform X2 [Anopheles arabiensis]XP_040218794.1 TM2 domain-containing protein almondex [Anopheles coluzzii]
MFPTLLYGRCVRLNWKSVVFLMMSLILSHIRITQSSVNSNNPEVTPTKLEKISSDTDRSAVTINSSSKSSSDTSHCPNDTLCTDLPNSCLQCTYNPQCVYGAEINVTCVPKTNVLCHADRLKTAAQNEIRRTMVCRYCYQTERWEHGCEQKGGCNSIDSQYKTNCTVHPELLCMGHRTFMKKIPCNWTQGYRWSTTLILSITIGGFGADRFFLGHWQEGIGKLFSFGGLGVWTLIDVLLISLHYLGPADGSLYI